MKSWRHCKFPMFLLFVWSCDNGICPILTFFGFVCQQCDAVASASSAVPGFHLVSFDRSRLAVSMLVSPHRRAAAAHHYGSTYLHQRRIYSLSIPVFGRSVHDNFSGADMIHGVFAVRHVI